MSAPERNFTTAPSRSIESVSDTVAPPPKCQVAAGKQPIVHEKELDIFIRDAEGHAAVRLHPVAHAHGR